MADALRSAEKFLETGKTPKSHSPTPEGVGLPRATIIPSWSPKTVTEQGEEVVHDKLLQKGFPLSVSGDSFPHAHLLGS